MSAFFKTRYPTGSELGERLLEALIANQDFTSAAELRDELDREAVEMKKKKAAQREKDSLYPR